MKLSSLSIFETDTGRNTWQYEKVPGIILFLRNTKEYNHIDCISFKILHFCNYTFLPTTVKVLETFLEGILWKPFQLFRRILNNAIASQKRRPFKADFSRGQKQKLAGARLRACLGYSMLSHCPLSRNPRPKPTGVLDHCREVEANCLLSIFSGRFLLTASLKRRRMSVYICLFTVASPVNNASEFGESFKNYCVQACTYSFFM